MPVRFIHLRDHDPHGAILAHGGATIAFEVVPGEDVGDKDVFFSWAECHYRDNFCRRVGRAKAGGKLNSPRYARHTRIPEGQDIREALIREYYDAKREQPIHRSGSTVYPWREIEKFRY
jgi:hypothetical protein